MAGRELLMHTKIFGVGTVHAESKSTSSVNFVSHPS
jgi:hypothetical protein